MCLVRAHQNEAFGTTIHMCAMQVPPHAYRPYAPASGNITDPCTFTRTTQSCTCRNACTTHLCAVPHAGHMLKLHALKYDQPVNVSVSVTHLKESVSKRLRLLVHHLELLEGQLNIHGQKQRHLFRDTWMESV